MKLLKLALCAAAATTSLGFATAALADGGPTWAFNAAVTNDYVFRGITQNAGKAAASGGIDFTDNIFYAGTWVSNVDFGKSFTVINGSVFASSFGDPSTYENDIYLGVRPTFGGVTWDLGYQFYNYINNSNSFKDNFSEFYLKGSKTIGSGSIGAAFNYSPNFFENVGAAEYYELNGSYTFKNKVTLGGAVDYQALTKSKAGLAGYTSWNLGATYPVTDHFSVDVRYWGTDGSAKNDFKLFDTGCFSPTTCKSAAGDRLAVIGKVTF
jgi:uncharacterized protein (TIGR02001 family)